MEFENYTDPVLCFNDHKNLENCKVKRQDQRRFQIKQGKMVMVKVAKSKFAQLNDKRFFSATVLSLYLFLTHC